MTLIEMMIVVLIIAIAATAVTWSMSAIDRANLRSGALTLAAASRYAYGRAIADNSTVRLKLDFSTNRISFEEAHGRVTLARLSDATRQELEDEDVSAVDPWAAAQARMSDALRPSFGTSPFSQIPGQRFQPRTLASGVQIERLFVPHEPDPREEGEGAIYFFPGGQTEHAIVWLSDDDDHVYSVEIHPLTGRARIASGAYEPDHLMDDGEGATHSEVRD